VHVTWWGHHTLSNLSFLHLPLISCKMIALILKCSSTCWNQRFLILNGTKRCPSHVTPWCLFSCPTLWEPSGSILPLVEGFFGGLLTWVWVCFPSSRCSFGYHTNTFPFMCGSKGMCLVISSSYHASILFIINPFSYNTTYPSWLATSHSCPPFIMSMWSYHWWFNHPFAWVLLWEWVYNIPWHISRYC